MTNKEIGQAEEELSKIEKMKRGHVQQQIFNFVKGHFILSIGVVIAIIIGCEIIFWHLITSFWIYGCAPCHFERSEAISIVRKPEITTATSCGLAMTKVALLHL